MELGRLDIIFTVLAGFSSSRTNVKPPLRTFLRIFIQDFIGRGFHVSRSSSDVASSRCTLKYGILIFRGVIWKSFPFYHLLVLDGSHIRVLLYRFMYLT